MIFPYSQHFHDGKSYFEELDVFTQQLGIEIDGMKTKTNTLDKQLEKRHGSVFEVDNVIRIEGYLYKQGKRGFKTWNRRWFYLENNKLCYSKRTGDEVTVMEEDLRVCLVRPLTDIDRRFCFEIISPTKSHVLQVYNKSINSYHTVRNLHFSSKNSTLISRENCRFFWAEKLVKMLWFWTF